MTRASITAHDLSTMPIGSVLMTTSRLEGYPDYMITAGARLILVANTLTGTGGAAALRLVPDDKWKLTDGDLREWGDAVMIDDPVDCGVEHEPGVDPCDRSAPGNAWGLRRIDAWPTPYILGLTDRLGAVFAHRMFDEVGRGRTTEIARRNRAERDPRICHSHDFCDANMVMHAAFRDLGERTPIDDPLGDPTVQAQWDAAWKTGMAWLVGDHTRANQSDKTDLAPATRG